MSRAFRWLEGEQSDQRLLRIGPGLEQVPHAGCVYSRDLRNQIRILVCSITSDRSLSLLTLVGVCH